MNALSPRWIAQTTALAVGWWLCGALALALFPLGRDLATVWPASGLALGVLLVWGRGLWPGIALGSLALGIGAGLTPLQALFYAVGSSLESWLGATLLMRFAGPRPGLGRLGEVLAFVGWGAIVSTAVGVITITTLLMMPVSTASAAARELEPWAVWLGHAIGVLLITPVMLTFANGRSPSKLKERAWEALALAIVAVAVCATVFTNMSKAFTVNPVPYMIFPLFFWAALRFGTREVSALLFTVGAAAVVATCLGNGPFAEGSPLQNLVSLYLFLAIAVIPTLLLAATLEERREAQAGLAESEAKYRLLVENQSELVLRLERDRSVAFASPACLEFFGRPAEEVKGQALDFAVHDDDREAMARGWAALFGTEGRCAMECRVMSREGWRWLAWSGQLEPAGDAAVVVARDVTARRRAEQQSRQHLEQLAHVSRVSSMDEMASAMAHEINQPLSAIATFTQACLRLLSRDPVDHGELAGAMRRVASEADRAGEIVRRIRRFVKNEPGQSVSVDLNFLVGEVIRLAQADARQSGVQLVALSQPGLPMLSADPIQVQQVLLNLVRNAIEALNTAGSARREVTIATASGPKAVEVTVTDSGPGVADIERAFEPFYSTKAEGMGIGLAISRSIIEAHGGRLTGQSSPGHGATFKFTLPLDEAAT